MKARVFCQLQSLLANANVSGFYLFFEPNFSTPSFNLCSIRLPSATSALGYTLSILASNQLENLLHTSFFRYFNFGDTLQKKTSQPRISTEMLDGMSWGRSKKACCQKILVVTATNTYPLLKQLGQGCLYHWKAIGYI